MEQLVITLVAGLSLGGTYALIGLGLVLVFRATDTFNFAHGQLMLLGAYLVGRWQRSFDIPFLLLFIASVAVVGVCGVLMHLLVMRRLIGQPVFMGVIATIGVAAIADGIMGIVFGSDQYVIRIPFVPEGVVTVLGARLSAETLVLTLFSLMLSLGLAILTRFTYFGIKLRVAGQDPLLAGQGGVDVNRMYRLSWAIGACLAAIAGISYGSTAAVTYDVSALALFAFPAIILGGFDSIEGAIVGGIGVGLIQSFVSSYWGGEWAITAIYAVLLVVLLVRPSGLLGTPEIGRV